MYNKITDENFIVFVINVDSINDKIVDEILYKAKDFKKIGINMMNVCNIKSQKFLNCLILKQFELFNISNDILVYLSIVMKNNFLGSYINFYDFKENKREFVKRHFLVA